MFISSSVDYFDFYSFGNEEKLVALVFYFSFRRVATSSIRKKFEAANSNSWLSVSRAQIRSKYTITPYSP